MIDAFLFDIGRVIVQFDFDLIYRRLEPLAGRPLTGVAQQIAPMLIPLETGQLTAADFVQQATALIGGGVTEHDFATAYMEIFTPNEPMWRTVERVASKVPVYLFSNISALHEIWLLKEYDVFQHFKGGLFSWRCGSMKPDDEIYRQGLELLGVPAERIGYVDDLEPNIATGRRFGFQSHLYNMADHAAFEDFLTLHSL